MATSIPLSSRIRGSLYGLAICDALGGPVEFKARGSFPLVTSMLRNENFDLPPGYFTDDTSMALCLAQSLLDNDGQTNIVDQVSKYIAWWQKGYMSAAGYCFDIGMTTQNALGLWTSSLGVKLGQLKPDSPAIQNALPAVEQKIISRFSDDSFCGNGSLMRLAPVALIGKSEAQVVALAADSSRTTHPHPRCVDACKLHAALIYQALNGATKADLAAQLANAVKSSASTTGVNSVEPALRERLQEYHSLKEWQSKRKSEIWSTGYVVDSFEAALWAFFNGDGFEQGAILAVNLGDDADTIGAIYGGLAGAFYGAEAIPQSWLDALKRKDLVQGVLQQILAHRNIRD